MEITILFNSEGISNDFATGWGFSALVDGSILFDTGEKGDAMLANCGWLDIDVAGIQAVVISHDHWDHTGGLWAILKKRKGIPVYACPGFSSEFKGKVKEAGGRLVEAKGFLEIKKDMFVTGEILGPSSGPTITEQAMVIKRGRGLVTLTGCAHPGIVNMLKAIQGHFPGVGLHFVLGGFHLMDSGRSSIQDVVEGFRRMGVEKVSATHCSGSEAEALFSAAYGEAAIKLRVGKRIEI
ncbi:MAG: MBL fold metallo-hydrolase [bacterium]